jgi:hypothetical protein
MEIACYQYLRKYYELLCTYDFHQSNRVVRSTDDQDIDSDLTTCQEWEKRGNPTLKRRQNKNRIKTDE